jgi:hypothetical protein
LLVGLVVRWVTALGWENIIWPDEIFQSLEQAHGLVFGYGFVPWEFREGLRSHLVPLFLAGFLWPFKYLPLTGSWPYTTVVRLVLCSLSVSLIVFAYRYARLLAGERAGLIAAFLLAGWYEFIYFAPKALGDMFGAYCLFPGLFFAERGLRDRRVRDLGWAGALLALGGMIRYQNLLLLPLIGLYLFGYQRAEGRYVKAYLFAALSVVMAAGALDWLIWGSPFHSLLVSVDFYLLRGGATRSTLTPLGWYFGEFWRLQGLLFPVFCGLALLAWPKAKLLWTVLLSYLLLHMLIAQKEYRYLFFLLPLLVTAAAVGGERALNLIGEKWRRPVLAAGLAVFLLGSLVQGVSLNWGKLGYRSHFIDPHQSAWTVKQPHLRAYRYLSGQSDLVGLHDWVDTPAWTPGYYYLHRWVPVQFSNGPDLSALSDRRANYCLVRGKLSDRRLLLVRQFADLTLYRKK